MENNILSTLWIQEDLDDLTPVCIVSWLNLGYVVHLYSYKSKELENNTAIKQNLVFKDANEILPRDNNLQYAPQADLFRYTLALKYKNEKKHFIWIDSDMFLLRRFPNDIDIISSEHTKKTGAFKSIKDYVANIGLLQFTTKSNSINWSKIIEKCLKSKTPQNSNRNNYMKIFQKEVKDLDIIVEPNAFCPVSWANFKELYQGMSCRGKFGMKVIENFYELLNRPSVFGIHLWRNLKNTNKTYSYIQSLFQGLNSINLIRKLKFFVPTYRRNELLQRTTLDYLKKSFILKEQIFLVLDQNDNSYDNLDYQKIYCPAQGIGPTRSWILNECDIVKDEDTIVMIDDDIEHFINANSEKIYLDHILPMTIEVMDKRDCKFAGFPLCSNPFFLKNNYTENLVYISGATQIHIIDRKREEVKTHLRQFEDFHFNIQYFLRDGLTLRNNRFAPITNHYNPEGGIVESYGSLESRLEDCKTAGEWLIQEYPDMCDIYWKKGSARVPPSYNIKLNRTFKY